MHPMFRTRTATGALYSDNRDRTPALERTPRRTRHPRLANGERLWAQSDAPADPLAAIDELGVSQAMASEMLELMADIGAHVSFCLRRREPLPAELLAHGAAALDWFIVLYSVGLLDRQGHWLGPAIGRAG